MSNQAWSFSFFIKNAPAVTPLLAGRVRITAGLCLEVRVRVRVRCEG